MARIPDVVVDGKHGWIAKQVVEKKAFASFRFAHNRKHSILVVFREGV